MEFLILFYEFFKAGLFAIGGGLATLPFLYEMADKYIWFDEAILTDMIAISESTPGAIGINMATYAGYNAGHNFMGVFGGVLGGIIATLGLITPSIIIITIIAKSLEKFAESKIVDDVFYILRPIVTSMIAVSALSIFQTALLTTGFDIKALSLQMFNWTAIILFLVLFAAMKIWNKLHPIVFILIAAVAGIVFKM